MPRRLESQELPELARVLDRFRAEILRAFANNRYMVDTTEWERLLDKVCGDVMAFAWGAPVPPKHVIDASNAVHGFAYGIGADLEVAALRLVLEREMASRQPADEEGAL